MTESAGWPPVEPDETQGGTPDPAPEDVPQAPPVPAEAAAEPPGWPAVDPLLAADTPAPPAPDPVPPPFIPDVGVAPWLRDLLLELHRRLRALGG